MYTTFETLSTADFETHALSLLSKGRSSRRRRAVLDYLTTTNKQDEALINQSRAELRTRQRALKAKQSKIDGFLALHRIDYTTRAEWLVDETLELAELTPALTEDDVELLASDYTTDLTISGSDITISGDGNEASARTEALQNTSTITGDIIISGKNIEIKNLNFQATSSKAVRFLAGAENVKFTNCIFTAPDGDVDSKFWYGANLKGKATLINCIVKSFTSWMLFDISSTSGEPTYATTKVQIKRCFFKDNLGSGAIRGKTGQATRLVQVENNKFQTSAMHNYFWAFCEASGHIKKAVFKGNEFIGPVGNDQVALPRHAIQLWNKSPLPWVCQVSENDISNMKLGICIAHNDGMYSPDTDSDDFLLAFGTHTDVTIGASFAHNNIAQNLAHDARWQTGAVYNPSNQAAYASAPTIDNPNSYAVFNG